MQIDIELYRRQIPVESVPPFQMSVIDIAPESPRRTLVFVHGYGGSARQWQRQLNHFAREDRVIAMDLRGHGASQVTRGGYRMVDLVRDLRELFSKLSIRTPVVLIGHSFGGAICVEFALEHPELVSNLVLIAAAGQYPLARRLRLALRIPVRLLNLAYPFMRSWLKAPPQVLKSMYQKSVRDWSGWSLFSELRVPTVVIRGHRDRVFEDQYFEQVALTIPEAVDVNVGASGHMVMLERTEAVNRAIERFLGAPMSWRDRPERSDLLKERPWLAYYDPDVPYTIGIPPVRLEAFLSSAASRFPSRAAISYFGHHTTYRRLDREVNRTAHALASLGVLPGERVMLLLPNSPQSVLCFYGVLRAGATVAFASPLSETQELIRQIKDSGARTLITTSDLRDTALHALEETGLVRVILTAIWEYMPWHKSVLLRLKRWRQGTRAPVGRTPDGVHQLSKLLYAQPDTPPEAISGQHDLAVIQYTGGTTDSPKGVMLTHRNLVSNTLQLRHWLSDAREGREIVLSVLPFSHSYGMMAAMSLPVSMAATMVVLPTFITEDVLEAIRVNRPTLFPGVPSMYTAVNDFPGVRRFGVESIRACISGAAPLPVEVQEAFEKLTRGRLVEGYGLTEASPVTHSNPLLGRRKIGTIGIPIPNTEARIVSLSRNRELAPGKIGELVVRGPQVMRGYWDDAQATEEALDKNGWLRTGDLARRDEDGYFQIIARKKEMILAGKYQVYPRDVEEVLYEHPKVKEAAAVGVERQRWPFQRVKAYVVLRKGETASEEELIDLCRRRLESYAVPWKVEFVDELPKTFVGKVLRRVLIERSEGEA